MHIHDRAAERDAQRPLRVALFELRLQFDPLQLGEDALQYTLVNPAPSAHVDRAPGAEPFGQGASATAFLGHEQPTLQHLARGQLAVPARSRHEQHDPRPLCVDQLHDPVDQANRPSSNSATGLD